MNAVSAKKTVPQGRFSFFLRDLVDAVGTAIREHEGPIYIPQLQPAVINTTTMEKA